MKDLPPLQWLRAFEAAARHLSFTHAAAELNVTQSAISQQIKLLENHLGNALFERRARSLQLTDSGYLYLPDIQTALELLRKSTQRHFQGTDSHSITIRSNWAFSVLWLSSRLGEFLDAYPGLSVNIIPALWETEYRDKPGSIQIHFASGPVTPEKHMLTHGLECFPVCSPRMAEKMTRLEDLLEHPVIQSTGILKQWDDYFEHCGLAQAARQSTQRQHATPAFVLALGMAQNSLGLALSHDLLVRDLLDSGQLVKPFEQAMPIEENYYLSYEPNNLSQAEQRFCDWLQDRFSK
jgi:LysR family glycine cleavage system transcriptional activator